jgi:hypothetical protein
VATFKELLSRPIWDNLYRLLALTSLFTAVFVYQQQRDLIDRQDRFVHCIAGYLDAQSASSGARSAAIEDSLRAVDASIHAVATSTTRAQVSKALADYEAARVAANAKRRDNPLPLPPAQRCDD